MNARSEKIGIFGGSFDPIHHGHLISAQDALEQLELDTLLFIPTALSPLRDAPLRASPEDRHRMIQLALANDPRFDVSCLEIERGGISYSIDTLRKIRKIHPSASTVLIIGDDQVPKLPDWRSVEELLELTEFAVFHRPGHPAAAEPSLPGLRLHRIQSHQIEISATEIRRRIREKRSVRFLLPEPVIEYINTNNLYL